MYIMQGNRFELPGTRPFVKVLEGSCCSLGVSFCMFPRSGLSSGTQSVMYISMSGLENSLRNFIAMF